MHSVHNAYVDHYGHNSTCYGTMTKSLPVMLGLGLGLEGCGHGLGLDHILVIVKLLRTVAHVMAVK